MMASDEQRINRFTGKPIAQPLTEASFADIQTGAAAARRTKGGFAWHIVHCVGVTDNHAIDWLNRFKFEHYYPAVREMRPVPKKQLSHKQRQSGIAIMRPRVVPFFPRYVFVRFDMGTDGWRELFKVAGVGGMVCEGQLPVWLPDALIEGIRSREIGGAVPGKTPARLIFSVGDNVRVADGPLASFNGVVQRLPDKAIEEIDPDDRIRVVVSIFGRATPVDLEISQIEKL